jgi:ADP-ribose pyrophosphatase YjhB (NUDIX family)
MPRQRSAVRGLLLSPANEILLMRLVNPTTPHVVWITPGGGLEHGEDPVVALSRELEEETGLSGISIGPLVWTRHHTFTFSGDEIAQSEKFYLVATDRFIPSSEAMPASSERDCFDGFRWWAIDEIVRSSEVFSPRRLGKLLNDLMEQGAPSSPIDTGV